jgi:hypothetical protein
MFQQILVKFLKYLISCKSVQWFSQLSCTDRVKVTGTVLQLPVKWTKNLISNYFHSKQNCVHYVGISVNIKCIILRYNTVQTKNLSTIFRDIMQCSLVQVHRRFRGPYCLRLSTCCLLGWTWRHYSPPKHHYTSTRLHGITAQKIVLFTVNYVKKKKKAIPVTGREGS